jgi:hypothetical protein
MNALRHLDRSPPNSVLSVSSNPQLAPKAREPRDLFGRQPAVEPSFCRERTMDACQIARRGERRISLALIIVAAIFVVTVVGAPFIVRGSALSVNPGPAIAAAASTAPLAPAYSLSGGAVAHRLRPGRPTPPRFNP